MLQVNDLYCERNGRVLFANLGFSVAAGEILQISGGNGTGKTTLLRILTGLYQDYEGEVEWSLEQWPLYVGHKVGVKDLLSPVENLRWLTGLLGFAPSTAEICNALARFGIENYRDTPCGSLSEGQRKRVNLSRLGLVKSDAWILDEPFSAIDADGVALLETLLEAHRAAGGLVLLTSHQALSIPVTRLQLGSGAPQ